MTEPTPEEMWPEVDPPTVDPGGAGGWVDAAAQAEANARAYADEQIPLVAGRMVPRNMDRAPAVGDGEGLLAGTGWNQYDPATEDLVQMWRWDGAAWVALDMSPQMIPVLDIGSATVGDLTGGRINVTDGPIVAGTPGGARVEMASDGLHAYDASGVETARIIGEEGVFVGGEFRTSDTLPGQVTLSDDAYVTHLDGGGTFPGVKVVPIDTTDMQLPAAIGPSVNGLTIFGGRNTAGGSSIVQANPTASFMRTFSGGTAAGEIQTSPTASYMRTFHAGGTAAGEIQTSPTASYMRTYREDGGSAGEIQTSPTASLMRTYREDGTKGGEIQTSPTRSMMRTFSGNSLESGWMRAQPQDAEIAYVDSGNTYFSRIKADASEAFIYTRAGGTTRVLSVDANGVWVKTGAKSYNLEETAQDSEWVNLSPESGFTALSGYGLRYRNKGGVIFFDGVAVPTSAMTGSWQTIASIPADACPDKQQLRKAVSSTMDANLRVTDTGSLQVYFLSGNNTSQVHISPMFHVAH